MPVMKENTRVAIFGGLAGFVFTRIPYMEDGNLLITNVVVLTCVFLAVVSWKIIKWFFTIPRST
mgnify:FL=1